VQIEVDANNAQVERYVIHELLHVVLSELVLGKFDSTLEEVLILAYENYLWDFVSAKPSRVAKWRKLVEKKLREGPPEPDVPLAVLVDRSADDKKDMRRHGHASHSSRRLTAQRARAAR